MVDEYRSWSNRLKYPSLRQLVRQLQYFTLRVAWQRDNGSPPSGLYRALPRPTTSYTANSLLICSSSIYYKVFLLFPYSLRPIHLVLDQGQELSVARTSVHPVLDQHAQCPVAQCGFCVGFHDVEVLPVWVPTHFSCFTNDSVHSL